MNNSSFWSFAISFWAILGAVCFLIVSLWLFILSVRSNKRSLVIEILRLVIVFLLIFTLFRPEFVRCSSKTEEPLVAVLCDASESMTTRDIASNESEALSRAQWLASRREAGFWAPLEQKYKVVIDDFAVLDTNAPSFDQGTDINLALENVMKTYDNLRAILLLSDGDWNQGKSPVFSATKLRVRNTPVFSVSVGSDKFLPDLELQSVAAPAYGLMDEHISLPFTIQSRLPHDVKTTVLLDGPDGMKTSKNILIPAMAQFQDSIILIPRLEGNLEFTLKLPVEKDEVFHDNNTKTFNISLRREILKVLVVESTPRWEYRFLRNALSRDPGVVVRCLLLHPGMSPGTGNDYISSFPDSKEELSQYDVVFLGDIGLESGKFTEENAEMIKGLVEKQGSGLVFLPGISGQQKTFLTGVLEELIPVELDKASAGFGFSMESRLMLTATGKDHLLTMLASNPAQNYAVWKRLPGFFWHAPVTRSKPGCQVLAVHATARNQHGRIPLLVTRNYGSGKVLFMGTDSAWRWRRGVEDKYHYRFWGQVVRWMAHQRHLAHEDGIRFFFSPESPGKGEKVFLHATVYDKSGFPLKSGAVHASITAESGHAEALELIPEDGDWGVFTGSFVPHEGGNYDIVVKCDKAERRVKTKIMVSRPRKEKIGRPARISVLREIAAITGGKCGGIENLEEIIQNINLLPEPKPLEERMRLWCHPLWAGLIVFLLAIYWAGRKLIGMI
ncbi:hypothetical protein ACFLS1_04115 [Verrucomicrobiota bacterium]